VELLDFVFIGILHNLRYTLFAQNVAVVCVIITLNTVGRMLGRKSHQVRNNTLLFNIYYLLLFFGLRMRF
jgi:uncharacterized membrane protein